MREKENMLNELFLNSIKMFYSKLHNSHVQLFKDQDVLRILHYWDEAPNHAQIASSETVNRLLAYTDAKPLNSVGYDNLNKYETNLGVLNVELLEAGNNFVHPNFYFNVWFTQRGEENLDAYP